MKMTSVSNGLRIAVMLVSMLCGFGAAAQELNARDCRYYQEAINGGDILPEKMLVNDWQIAMQCRVGILASLKNDVKEGKKLDQFVRTTGAIRIIMASRENSGKLNLAIDEFRKNATLDAASSLAFGVRSDVDNARLNAVLVFGNVVDNQTVCVAIDHLYDPKIMNSEPSPATVSQTRGRANLLAITAVVAPWAYKENYENLVRVHKATSEAVEATKGVWDLKSTSDVLRRLGERLEYQKTIADPNMNTSLPKGLDACRSYKPSWAGDRLKY